MFLRTARLRILHPPAHLPGADAGGRFRCEQDSRTSSRGWKTTESKLRHQPGLNQIYETPEIPLDFQTSKGPAGSDIYSTGLQDPEVDAAVEATKSM
jgi:hypothetical protein